MKILRIVNYGYDAGGVENGVVATNKILRERGHDVRTLTSNAKHEFADYTFEKLPTSGFKKILYTSFNYRAYKRLREVLKDFNPDVILVHTTYQSSAAPLFCLKKRPTILFVHGPELYIRAWAHWYIAKEHYKNESYEKKDLKLSGRLQYVYFAYICRFFYKISMQRVDKIVSLSNFTKATLAEEHIKSEYIPNGVELMGQSPKSKGNPTLLYVGRLEKYKGVGDLVGAMPQILASVPDARLEIAGDGNFKDKLQNLAQTLHVEKSVTFLGKLNRKQIADAYNRSAALVLPSTYPETFGKVGIEAMSVGRPVIATDVGGIRDWLKDGINGYLVDVSRPDQIARKAIHLLTDKKLTKRMAKNAQATAAHFSMEQFTDNIERLCRSITATSHRPKL